MTIQMFNNELIKLIYVPVLMLLIGDLLSTFLYHVPEHAFGKFHSAVHHSANRSFLHYAVLNKNPLVLLDGIAGALPYIIFRAGRPSNLKNPVKLGSKRLNYYYHGSSFLYKLILYSIKIKNFNQKTSQQILRGNLIGF